MTCHVIKEHFIGACFNRDIHASIYSLAIREQVCAPIKEPVTIGSELQLYIAGQCKLIHIPVMILYC